MNRVDRLLDVLGDLVEFRRTGLTAFEHSVRVAGVEPVVRDFEALAAEGIRACHDPVPLHPDVAVGSSCNLVRREERPPGSSMGSNQ